MHAAYVIYSKCTSSLSSVSFRTLDVTVKIQVFYEIYSAFFAIKFKACKRIWEFRT
jgi:hypothetical protein